MGRLKKRRACVGFAALLFGPRRTDGALVQSPNFDSCRRGSNLSILSLYPFTFFPFYLIPYFFFLSG